MTDAREARALAQDRSDLLRAESFEQLCPHVLGNPFIPHFPLPAQAMFLGMHQTHEGEGAFEALYGGAAGGGKSDALLMGAAQFAWRHSEFAGVCIRRTFKQLIKADALLDRAMKWWIPAGATWNGTEGKFRFPSGATVEMTYHGHPRDDQNFQGAAYQYVAWDELTHWPDDRAYRWVSLSRMRKPANSVLPLRSLSASNPGSDGHAWVKQRFVGGINIETGLHEEPLHPLVRARIQDNPHLDIKAYIKNLEHLHPTTRDQLLDGNWDAREPGDYFRAEWFGPLLDPEKDAWPDHDKISVRWWDLAASEKPDACHTAGVLMSRHVSGVRAVEHCRSFKATPGKRDSMIVQQAHLDGRRVVVGIEIEPGSGGVAQFEALAKILRKQGFRVAGARPRATNASETDLVIKAPTSETGKAARCAPVASCLERGYQRRGEGLDTGGGWWGLDIGKGPTAEKDGLRMFVGPWTQAYLDVLEGFPGEGRMDEADATSGAWSYLEAHAFGLSVALSTRNDGETGRNSHDIHPDLRPDTSAKDQDRAGRWVP